MLRDCIWLRTEEEGAGIVRSTIRQTELPSLKVCCHLRCTVSIQRSSLHEGKQFGSARWAFSIYVTGITVVMTVAIRMYQGMPRVTLYVKVRPKEEANPRVGLASGMAMR